KKVRLMWSIVRETEIDYWNIATALARSVIYRGRGTSSPYTFSSVYTRQNSTPVDN
ncbi:hypothetical protein J6590_050598, partial [Homalodisca vitripennis]